MLQKNCKIRSYKNKPAVKEIVIGEFKMRVYALGWLALKLNRHPHSVRRWETGGILPKPILKVEGSEYRYYMPSEIQGYTKLVTKATINGRVDLKTLKLLTHDFHLQLRQQVGHSLEDQPTKLDEEVLVKQHDQKIDRKRANFLDNLDKLIKD